MVGGDWRFAFFCLALLLPGCSVVHPYLSQPSWDGTFAGQQGALQALQDVQTQLANEVESQNAINVATNAGTFIGLGTAGISAIFRGPRDLILGAVTAGTTSAAVGALYGNRNQTTVYNNGLDAAACIEDSVAPITSAYTSLNGTLTNLVAATQAAQDQLRSAVSAPAAQRDEATAMLVAAGEARTHALAWLNSANTTAAPQLIHAVRSVVSTVNKQLQVAIPDAAAFARAGSGLQTMALANQPPVKTPSASTGSSLFTRNDVAAEVRNTQAPDPVLSARIQALRAAIDAVSSIVSQPIVTPAVTCHVADAPGIAPIGVVIPAGGSDLQIAKQATATFQINGGTYPYTGIVWSPNAPTCFKASILSPNTLQFAPTDATTCTDKDNTSFNFDIYDATGQHMPHLMVLKVLPKGG